MRARGTSDGRPPEPPDREVWRRSQQIEAPADEIDRLLDLAAFADNRLDDDDAARVAALLAVDPDAADDIAAARALANVATAVDPGVIARAAALVDTKPAAAQVIAFPAPRAAPRRWYSAATWSGLAAAMLLAGWLGFNLGSGLSGAPAAGGRADEVSSNELIDFNPPPLLLHDFSENTQI